MTESKLRIVAPLNGSQTRVYLGDSDLTIPLGIRRIDAVIEAGQATEVTLHVFPDVVDIEVLPKSVRAILADADESELRNQLRLAMVRMSILVDRITHCHTKTNNHKLSVEEGND